MSRSGGSLDSAVGSCRWDGVSLNVPCPICRAALELTPHGEFDSWICPAGHGRAATLSELYERAQEDEIHRLWALAKASWVAGRARDRPGLPDVQPARW